MSNKTNEIIVKGLVFTASAVGGALTGAALLHASGVGVMVTSAIFPEFMALQCVHAIHTALNRPIVPAGLALASLGLTVNEARIGFNALKASTDNIAVAKAGIRLGVTSSILSSASAFCAITAIAVIIH